jgi:exopolysaccharide biosynthesis polyprenyl glycosylphosphotransferase
MQPTRTGSGIEHFTPLATGDEVSPSPPPVSGLARTAREPSTPLWVQQYRIVVVTLDLCAIILGAVASYELRFGALAPAKDARTYLLTGLFIAVVWIVALQYVGSYDIRHLATGPEEAKRVLRASAATISITAIACYATKTPIARGFVIGVIPVATVLILIERSLVRRAVSRRRRNGRWVNRIVAVGTVDSVRHLLEVTKRAPDAGLRIVGVCVEDAEPGFEVAPGVPVLGGVLSAAEKAAWVDADVVAVTGSGLGPRAVRELGWQLEGTGRGMVMAPALTEIAGTRVHVSPVEGLPLVWVEQPRLGRLPRLVKRTMDVAGAALVLLLSSPILLATAALIKITSRGPVFFRQRRLGLNGTEFTILKFRSMYAGAELRRDELIQYNEQDGGGVLFKIRADPRITRVGKWIRKLSIDELPQLLHVLSGTMSLVGPRPLATEDSIYTGSARRRLLVRPGLTGLWQVSGRSNLSWDDAVRLDLYYVENWSLALDAMIVWKTVFAILRRHGAY